MYCVEYFKFLSKLAKACKDVSAIININNVNTSLGIVFRL